MFYLLPFYQLLDLFLLPQGLQDDEYKHLLVRKEETLISIKELEFDFNTEKISETDYKELLHRLETEATRILEHLDQLEQRRKKDKPHKSR